MIRELTITAALLCGATVPARCDPPPPHCDGLIPLLAMYAPASGWDTARMSRIAWRESRCQPNAYNRGGGAAGLFQITPVNHRYLRVALGEWVDRWTLLDPIQNVRAAAALFDYWSAHGSGYQPWSL